MCKIYNARAQSLFSSLRILYGDVVVVIAFFIDYDHYELHGLDHLNTSTNLTEKIASEF